MDLESAARAFRRRAPRLGIKLFRPSGAVQSSSSSRLSVFAARAARREGGPSRRHWQSWRGGRKQSACGRRRAQFVGSRRGVTFGGFIESRSSRPPLPKPIQDSRFQIPDSQISAHFLCFANSLAEQGANQGPICPSFLGEIRPENCIRPLSRANEINSTAMGSLATRRISLEEEAEAVAGAEEGLWRRLCIPVACNKMKISQIFNKISLPPTSSHFLLPASAPAADPDQLPDPLARLKVRLARALPPPHGPLLTNFYLL